MRATPRAVKGRAKAGSHALTDADYAARLAEQGGGCAICGNPPKTRRLHTDRDHRTGQVRGLLCYRCNRALPAWIKPLWLEAASDYLQLGARTDGGSWLAWEQDGRLPGRSAALSPPVGEPVDGAT